MTTKPTIFNPENAPFKLDADGSVRRIMRRVSDYQSGMNFLSDMRTLYGHRKTALDQVTRSFEALHSDKTGAAKDRLAKAYYGGGLVAIAAFTESDLKGISVVEDVLNGLQATSLPTQQQAAEIQYTSDNPSSVLVTPIMSMFPETVELMDEYSKVVERANHPSTGPVGAAAVHITVSQIYQAYDFYMNAGIAQLMKNGLDS